MVRSETASRVSRPVQVSIGIDALNGDLTVPAGATGLVLFAHGSGSSRLSPRNQFVAQALNARGFATLLIDLLTREEEAIDRRTGHIRFDIHLLAHRLLGVIAWLKAQPDTSMLPIGLFGASTGGGAALVAAALRPFDIAAVVSRGGRPDLAGAELTQVIAPTLLIVGGLDAPVIAMNRHAMSQIPGSVRLEIVEGATHLFEEPGALERVAMLAGNWFAMYFDGAHDSRVA
jgi:putative phosphoribosyl transferase